MSATVPSQASTTVVSPGRRSKLFLLHALWTQFVPTAIRLKLFLRRRLFSAVRGVSFRLLKALNPDVDATSLPFLANSRPTAARTAAPGLEQAKPAAAGAVARPVVINSEHTLLNSEMADFLLRGVFPQEHVFRTARDRFAGSLVGSTFEEADAALEKAVAQLARQTPEAANFEICKQYFEHREMTARNRRAYQPSGRLNPLAVFWPDPTDPAHPRSLFTELPFARRTPIIDPTTAIVSAGSCFATEIAHFLQKSGYNYLVKEPNHGEPGTYELLDAAALPNASAAWGLIFNTPSFLQLVEKAFGVRQLPTILWSREEHGKVTYLDPFRENIAFDSVEAYEANVRDHLRAAHAAFCEMDVFVITLGLNEVWYFKADGSVFSRNPWRMAPSLVGHKVLTVAENVRDLTTMTEILRRHNPKVKIIVTVSPVPLHATFRADEQHIVSANAHSKAVLRVAAEEFASTCREVYYFPSYEVVTVATEKPWAADQRHVSPEAVANVMRLFQQMFDKQAVYCSQPAA